MLVKNNSFTYIPYFCIFERNSLNWIWVFFHLFQISFVWLNILKAFASIQQRRKHASHTLRLRFDQSVSTVLNISIEKSCFQLWMRVRRLMFEPKMLLSQYWKRITGCQTINPITQMKLNWYLFLLYLSAWSLANFMAQFMNQSYIERHSQQLTTMYGTQTHTHMQTNK